MGVSSRSAIVLDFDWTLRSRRASYILNARLIVGEGCICKSKKGTADGWNLETEFGIKESPSHVRTYTITIKAKAENPDSKASPLCAI